jgi:hypothetical protein
LPRSRRHKVFSFIAFSLCAGMARHEERPAVRGAIGLTFRS